MRAHSALFNIRCSVCRRRDTRDLALQVRLLLCTSKGSLAARQDSHPLVHPCIESREKSSYMQKGLDVGQKSCWSPSEYTKGCNN